MTFILLTRHRSIVRRDATTARFTRSSHSVTAARPHRGGWVLNVPNPLPAIHGLLAAAAGPGIDPGYPQSR